MSNPISLSAKNWDKELDEFNRKLAECELRERALINGYNSEISKYKTQLRELRLQLGPRSPSKDIRRDMHSAMEQNHLKQYLLRQVKRLQDELDKNSQSVAEVLHALEVKKASELDLEQRLAAEAKGHQDAKVAVSELKQKLKRLGERCHSASFEAEKTFLTIETELSYESLLSVHFQGGDDEFASAVEESFEKRNNSITKGDQENKPGKKVTSSEDEGVVSSEDKAEKKSKRTLGNIENTIRSNLPAMDSNCLEQKIVNKNREIVKLQEQLVVQSKLERNLLEKTKENKELSDKLQELRDVQTELCKKGKLIQQLESKVGGIAVLEVEIESQAEIIQHLRAAIEERTLLLSEHSAKLQSSNTSPVSERKIEEMETVMKGLREMIDSSTKDLAKKEEHIREMVDSNTKELAKKDEQIQKMVDSNTKELATKDEQIQALEEDGISLSALEIEIQILKTDQRNMKADANNESLKCELEKLKEEKQTVSEQKNSLENEIDCLKELVEKQTQEILGLKSQLKVKEVEGEKENAKTIDNLKNALQAATTARKALDKSIDEMKKEAFIKDEEIIVKINKIEQLEKENKNLKSEAKAVQDKQGTENEALTQTVANLECQITNVDQRKMKLLKEMENMAKHVTALKTELSAVRQQKLEMDVKLKNELGNLKSQFVGKFMDEAKANHNQSVLSESELVSQQQHINKLNSEVVQLKKDLDENVKARDKLLVEISGLVSSLSEKNEQISELNKVREQKEDSDTEKKAVKTKSMIDCESPKKVKAAMCESSQSEKPLESAKDPVTSSTGSKISVRNSKPQNLSDSGEKKCLNLMEQELEKMSSKLELLQKFYNEEKSLNEDIKSELNTVKTKLSEVKSSYDVEKNVTFCLRYELDDIKSSLNEVIESYEQLNQSRHRILGDQDEVTETPADVNIQMDSINAKLTPQQQTFVKDLQTQMESWKNKYEQVTMDLYSERQKLLDSQNCRAENFYTKKDNEKLKKELAAVEKKLNDIRSQQEIQQITMETNRMTKELIDERKRSDDRHLQEDLERLRHQLQLAREKSNQCIQLQAEVEDLKEENSQLKKKVITTDKEDCAADRNSSEGSGDSKHLEEEGRTLEEEGRTLEEEVRTLKEEVRTLKEENEELKRQVLLKEKEICSKDNAVICDGTVNETDVATVEKNQHLELEIETLKRNLSEEKLKWDNRKNCECEKLREENQKLANELEVSQKKVIGLQEVKVGLKTDLLPEFRVGSSRQLRREKILAETAKLEAEFALKSTKEKVEALTKEVGELKSLLAKDGDSIGKTSVLGHKPGESTPCNCEFTKTLDSRHQDEMKSLKEELEAKLMAEKGQVASLQQDLKQTSSVMETLKSSLKEQEETMVSLEDIIDSKDTRINRLEEELAREQKYVSPAKINKSEQRKLSLSEDDKLKTVVSNQTQTIQVLSEEKSKNEITCTAMNTKLKNLKIELTIMTAERDSLRKRLHLSEGRTLQTPTTQTTLPSQPKDDDLQSGQKLYDQRMDKEMTSSQKKMEQNEDTFQSPGKSSEKKSLEEVMPDCKVMLRDVQQWRKQKALIVDSIKEGELKPPGATPRSNSPLTSPLCRSLRLNPQVSSSACRTTRFNSQVSSSAYRTTGLNSQVSSSACRTTRLNSQVSSPACRTKRLNSQVSSSACHSSRLNSPLSSSATHRQCSVKRTSDSYIPVESKKVCVSTSKDPPTSVETALETTSSPQQEAVTPGREAYIQIDATPPVAAKALKKNRKRKPLESPGQHSLLNTSKISISSKSLTLCLKANISDEDFPENQQVSEPNVKKQPSRLSKSEALKKIQSQMNVLKESPLSKKKKSLVDVTPVSTYGENTPSTAGTTSPATEPSQKTTLGRFRNLTNSFRSPSFKRARNLFKQNNNVFSPVWDSPRKPAVANMTISSPAQKSSALSRKLDRTESDAKNENALRNILTEADPTVRRKRRLYKEEIIGPMSFMNVTTATTTATTTTRKTKDDVFSIVKQQLRSRRK